jgi:acid phosphatase (class A)
MKFHLFISRITHHASRLTPFALPNSSSAPYYPHRLLLGMKTILESRMRGRVLDGRLLGLCLLLAVAPSLFAEDRYLTPGHLDGIALLAPPPAPGSAEEAADLASVRAVFRDRTPAQEARATKDSGLGFDIFTAAIGPVFQNGHLPITRALLGKVKKEIGEVIDTSKDHWKRRRPYQMDEHSTLGAAEPSFGYPSGHSTRGTVYALVLAEVFPAKKENILAVGRDIGWDRVILGKHFPTDVYAGRVLGQAIVRELRASPAFQHDLAEAQAEVQAASHEPGTGPAR